MSDLERLFGTAYEFRLPILVTVIVAAIVVLSVGVRSRWDRVALRHPRISAAGAVALLVAAVLPAWYLASPLVLSSELIEPDPAAVVQTDPVSVPLATPDPNAAASAGAPPAFPSTGAEPTSGGPGTVEPSVTVGAPAAADETRGTFTGTDDFHFARGTARLIVRSDGSAILRFEKFAVRNGPDLFVYLSPRADRYTKDSLELGRLKADRGSFNYKVPGGADLSKVKSAVIWCKQFSFQFAVAPLS